MSARAAFDALLVAELPKMRRLAMSLTGNRERADDLVQDTVVRVLSKWESFIPGSNFGAWVWGCMRNGFLTGIRSSASRAISVDPETTHHAALVVAPVQESPALVRDMTAAFASLPMSTKTMLIYSAVEDRSYEDIAEDCRLPIGTVKSRISRARAHLRQAVEMHA